MVVPAAVEPRYEGRAGKAATDDQGDSSRATVIAEVAEPCRALAAIEAEEPHDDDSWQWAASGKRWSCDLMQAMQDSAIAGGPRRVDGSGGQPSVAYFGQIPTFWVI